MGDKADAMELEEEEEEVVVTDLTNSDVVTKYKMAADIANKAMQGAMKMCKPGTKTRDVCKIGDLLIVKQCEPVFKKAKSMEKGIAFPMCVSVNDCVCHHSPLESEDCPELKVGDVVKLDCGVHIDGFIAVSAHTFVVSENPDQPAEVTGKDADLIKAAYLAAEACAKVIKPGVTNTQVTDVVKQVATDFGVTPIQGVLMHQMKQFIIDGNDVIIQRSEVDQKVEEFTFEDRQVYTIDICFSTGEGKPIQRESRTTVFKRMADVTYNLKMKSSRTVFREIQNRFSVFPFTTRALPDEKQARMGVVECLKHDLIHGYPVLWEKPEDRVAHFKFTVLLLPSGTAKITGMPVDLEKLKSDKEPSDAVKAILATSALKKKKKKKKKKKAAADGGAAAAPMETD